MVIVIGVIAIIAVFILGALLIKEGINDILK